MASFNSLRLILLVLFVISVQSRILRLNSSDDHLISDGIDYVEKQSSSIVTSIPNTCDHQYGFLPCAENAAGYIFQILVYQGLLIFGEKQIGKGSKVLFHIIGAGKFGGIIFRILMALPSMMLMIAEFPDSLSCSGSLFKQFDSDGDKSISASELEQLISTVKFGEFQPKYEDVVKELFKDFDKDNNNIIDEPEFVEGVKKWLNKAMRVANTPDRTRSIDEYDKIVWQKAVYNKWALMMSLFQVMFGIVILTFLGGPLMVSILQLSYEMGLPSFSISFVIVPLAMNARAALNAFLPASQKSERSASLTFSEIYGGVIMNNIAGLTTLLAIVYAKDLTWDFSAEVLTVLVVCAVIGILAFSCTTYRLWTCILAFFLYPFSLGLCYLVQVFWKWH